MENDRSQYLQRYGCSPVWVRKCRVRLALRGNALPQYEQVYLSRALFTPGFGGTGGGRGAPGASRVAAAAGRKG